MSKFNIGRWESPWASEPYLGIRVAIEVQRRTIVLLHQFIDQSWIPFTDSDDAYLRALINDEFDDIIGDPESYHMRRADAVPAAWLYEAHPDEVDISCPVLPSNSFHEPFRILGGFQGVSVTPGTGTSWRPSSLANRLRACSLVLRTCSS